MKLCNENWSPFVLRGNVFAKIFNSATITQLRLLVVRWNSDCGLIANRRARNGWRCGREWKSDETVYWEPPTHHSINVCNLILRLSTICLLCNHDGDELLSGLPSELVVRIISSQHFNPACMRFTLNYNFRWLRFGSLFLLLIRRLIQQRSNSQSKQKSLKASCHHPTHMQHDTDVYTVIKQAKMNFSLVSFMPSRGKHKKFTFHEDKSYKVQTSHMWAREHKVSENKLWCFRQVKNKR